MVGYDQQVKQVVTDLALVGKKGAVIVITATSHPDMILECGVICRRRGMGVVDAPVCFGLGGARDGTLASLVGGSKKDVEKARPVLECYSRAVHHLGELGAGEIGKTDQKAELQPGSDRKSREYETVVVGGASLRVDVGSYGLPLRRMI